MSSQGKRHLVHPRMRVIRSSGQPDASPAEHFEISVVFTTNEISRHALQAVGNFVRDANVLIKQVALRMEPFAFPLVQPPVPVASTERQFTAIATNAEVKSEFDALICNCRNPYRALKKILNPRSLVVINGKGHLWPTATTRLAASLWSGGHEVILAENREGSRAGSFLSLRWRPVFCHLLGLYQGL